MTITSPEFDQAFQSFLASCQDMITKYYETFHEISAGRYSPSPFLVAEEGTRYIRIIRNIEGQRSVFAFVDSLNGDILKPASWRQPAKHSRGNIFDQNPLAKMTAYGPEYIK